MIQFKNVSKIIDGKTILENIDFEIPSGSAFALLGSNGAGKSTILRLISGVYNAEKGEILINGEKVFDNPKVKEKIFFINDETIQFTNFTLLELKNFYKNFYPKFSEETFAKLESIINLPINIRLSKFSKGMKRQAIIIVGLACNTDYLLLDESFDGIDPTMRLIAKRLIFDAMADRELTVIISSHNLKEINELCDKCIIIHEGKIIDKRDLLDNDTNLFKIQAAFNDNVNITDIFKDLPNVKVIHIDKNMSVYNIIISGNKNTSIKAINKYSPLICDIMPLSLEETFIYEMEEHGYADNKQ